MTVINDKIIKTVAQCNGLSVEELLGKRRQQRFVEAREMLYAILYFSYDYRLTQIADLMGKNHTTVYHALEQYKTDFVMNPDFRKRMLNIKLTLNV